MALEKVLMAFQELCKERSGATWSFSNELQPPGGMEVDYFGARSVLLTALISCGVATSTLFSQPYVSKWFVDGGQPR